MDLPYDEAITNPLPSVNSPVVSSPERLEESVASVESIDQYFHAEERVEAHPDFIANRTISREDTHLNQESDPSFSGDLSHTIYKPRARSSSLSNIFNATIPDVESIGISDPAACLIDSVDYNPLSRPPSRLSSVSSLTFATRVIDICESASAAERQYPESEIDFNPSATRNFPPSLYSTHPASVITHSSSTISNADTLRVMVHSIGMTDSKELLVRKNSKDPRVPKHFPRTSSMLKKTFEKTLVDTIQKYKQPSHGLRRCIYFSLFLFFLLLSLLGVGIALSSRGSLRQLFVSINHFFSNPGGTSPAPVDPFATLLSSFPSNGPNNCSNVPSEVPSGGTENYLPCNAGQIRYTLSECDLQAMMPELSTSISYLSPLNDALEAYSLNCVGPRLSSFLATIRHETAGLTLMTQKSDGGSGSIHLIPAHFQDAIQAIPALSSAYTQQFGAQVPLSALNAYTISNPLDSLVQNVGLLINQPQFTFMVGGWWFIVGSRIELGCEDLRVDSDLGLGIPASFQAPNSTAQTSTGFYRVSECIFGRSSVDAGLSQRIDYYNAINEISSSFSCQTLKC